MKIYVIDWCMISTIILISWILVCHFHRPNTPAFTDANCIRALIGEYAEDDYYGMTLMAHAIRNRGTLKGVYGFYAKHIKKEPKKIWITATLAWEEAKRYKLDLVSGATEWRSIEDVRRGHAPNGMWLVKIYNGTYFYKNPSK